MPQFLLLLPVWGGVQGVELELPVLGQGTGRGLGALGGTGMKWRFEIGMKLGGALGHTGRHWEVSGSYWDELGSPWGGYWTILGGTGRE